VQSHRRTHRQSPRRRAPDVLCGQQSWHAHVALEMSTTSATASSWRGDNSLRPLRGNSSSLILGGSRPSSVWHHSTGARSLISWCCSTILGIHPRTQDRRNFCHSESRQVENRSRSSRLKSPSQAKLLSGVMATSCSATQTCIGDLTLQFSRNAPEARDLVEYEREDEYIKEQCLAC
jgi:hypothetical protein